MKTVELAYNVIRFRLRCKKLFAVVATSGVNCLQW